MMRRLVWLTCCLVMACAHGGGATRGKVEGKQVFVSTTGVHVEVVLLENNRCVVRTRGVTVEKFSGHAFGCEVQVDDQKLNYVIQRDGGGWRVITKRKPGFEAWIPGERDALKLTLDEAAGAALDADALLALHEKETADGTLAKIAAFDRATKLTNNDKDLAAWAQTASKACGATYTGKVALDGVSDEQVGRWAYGEICASAFEAMRDLCVAGPAREFFSTGVKRVECSVGDESKPDVLALDGTTVRVTLNDMSNLRERARTFFGNLGASDFSKARTVPWGDGSSLADRLTADAMSVCADDKGHVVTLDPDRVRDGDDTFSEALYMGSAKELYRVQGSRAIPWFFLEPRYVKKGETGGARFHSSVSFKRDENVCVVSCGDREVKVPMLSAADGAKLVLGAKFVDSPFTRVPYTLLRDRRGTYYYVDTSSLPNREKDFHVWVGQRGKMKRLPLTNVVSDSAGDLFTTKAGELRLSLDKEKGSFWHEKNANLPLRPVPVEENYDVIFNELGVYTERLGNPCDDF